MFCSGGYNTTDKIIISDIFNITFNINKNSKQQLFNIEKQDFFQNAHNSWVTGLITKNYQEFKDNNFNNFFSQSNILNNNLIFLTASHDKKVKIWKYYDSKSLI